MKKILLLMIILSFISCKTVNYRSEYSFEGFVKFSTSITTTEKAPSDFLELLNKKYGDSLIMYYSKNGNFKRVHINSDKYGTNSQFYIAKEGKVYITHNNDTYIDTINTNQNSLNLLNKRKIRSEKIIGLDCECYEYKAISMYDQNVTLNYCFSSKSPEINSNLYLKHNDFFLNDYYKLSKRPYLKFSIETDEFKIIYLATELTEKKIKNEVFKITVPNNQYKQ